MNRKGGMRKCVANLGKVGVSGLRRWDPKFPSISGLETLKDMGGN